MARPNRGVSTLLGLPYDGSSSFLKGTAAAPPLIRQALHSPAGNPWTETGVDLGAAGALGDAGDVPFGGSAAEARAKIEEAVRTLLESGGRPIVLGGDHSVTYPIVRAVRWFHPRLSILHFDAHPDLYPEFEGDRYSHACPFARIMEERLTDRLVQVGIRTLYAGPRAQGVRHREEGLVGRDGRGDNVAGARVDGPGDGVGPSADRVQLEPQLRAIADQLRPHHQNALRQPRHRAQTDALAAADEEHVHVEEILVVDAHRDFRLRIDRCDGAAVTGRGGERAEQERKRAHSVLIYTASAGAGPGRSLLSRHAS